MYKVKIYGAGSIGNHLANACCNKGWDVLICDIDQKALDRTKMEIYPSRYGKWNDSIRLVTLKDLKPEYFDLVIIGTPPDTHIKIALSVLESNTPKALLIEKPLCTPSLEGCQELLKNATSKGVFVGVGYNHTLTENTFKAADILRNGLIGKPLNITAMFREHWGGIFSAHPWLNGAQDTYLGFHMRGGGAGGEHSHAINIWQHFASLVGAGKIVEVSSMLDMVDDGVVSYDRICQICARTENGLIGDIIQDVITDPSKKYMRIQGDKGALEWCVNFEKNCDALIWQDQSKKTIVERISKTRLDDFKWEIEHLEDIMEGKIKDSPISLERGLDTMMVIAAAHISNKLKRTVRINYRKGYSIESIE